MKLVAGRLKAAVRFVGKRGTRAEDGAIGLAVDLEAPQIDVEPLACTLFGRRLLLLNVLDEESQSPLVKDAAGRSELRSDAQRGHSKSLESAATSDEHETSGALLSLYVEM
jgi:hypothetical protein